MYPEDITMADRDSAGIPRVLLAAVKQQRVGLACALTVALVLVGYLHAPAKPVFFGCGAALVLLVALACRKSIHGRF